MHRIIERIERVLVGAAIVAIATSTALARNNDVLPRNGIDPWDKAKVNQAESRNWLNRDAQRMLPSEKKNCQANVATQQQPQGPQYGTQAKQNQVVVVKGDVINVCK